MGQEWRDLTSCSDIHHSVSSCARHEDSFERLLTLKLYNSVKTTNVNISVFPLNYHASLPYCYLTPISKWLGFPESSVGKESASSVGDLGSIPGLGRSPGEGQGYPHQYSGLENSMDYIVHGVAKSRTRLPFEVTPPEKPRMNYLYYHSLLTLDINCHR